jgi:hypothetical protein
VRTDGVTYPDFCDVGSDDIGEEDTVLKRKQVWIECGTKLLGNNIKNPLKSFN